MEWLTDPQAWIALATLTALEIVLGIDNIIFISLLSGKLPPEQQQPGRIAGLAAAMLMRIALLLSLSWMMALTEPLFAVFGHAVSGRDLILIGGGLFLLGKSTFEIHGKLEGEDEHHRARAGASFAGTLVQIALLDIVFSLDSVITAIGMAEHLGVMIAAVVIAVVFMMLFARPLSDFVHHHPTVQMLALSFLILIGLALVADGVGHHIPKGYIYFSMGFAVLVEMLNMRLRRVTQPLELRGPRRS